MKNIDMNKQDLREYGASELSMRVLNEEPLYKQFIRSAELNRFNEVEQMVSEIFLFTPEQLDDLEEDFEAEVEERSIKST